MNIDNIKNYLLQRGYSIREAEVLSEDLCAVSEELKPILENWIQSGKESDYASHGFSIKGLMGKYGLKYPAALLSIDWVVKEPNIAIPAIEKGIR